MAYYIGVRRIKDDRGERWEARLVGIGVNSRCLGFFDTPEAAARAYNAEAAKQGLELNTDIPPVLKRVRTADGVALLMVICGLCGQARAFNMKTGVAHCCGITHQTPANAEELPIEQSQKFGRALRRARRQLDRIMKEEMTEKFSRKILYADDQNRGIEEHQ